MIPVNLGLGLAPDVQVIGGVVSCVFGAQNPDRCDVATIQGGVVTNRVTLPDGFFNSFPRFGADTWVAYKTIAFTPRAWQLRTGQTVGFTTPADGNWPLFVAATDIYWQTGNTYDVWWASLLTGSPWATGQNGAPDGIERLDGNTVVCRKDIRLEDPTVGGYPSYAGDLTVGQYGYGIGVRLDGQAVRWIPGDPSDDHPDPRCATDGTLYAITSWGKQGVRVWTGDRAALLALPLAPIDTVPPDPGPEPPEPPDPGPEPPEPPEPGPEPEPIPPITGGPLTQETGWLIGPGDRVLSCSAAGVVTFAATVATDADLMQLDPIEGDRRGTYRPVVHLDIYLTADSTQFAPGGNACLAYYGAKAADVLGPDGKPGWYQRWDVGVWPSGIVTALVPYIEQGANNGRHFASPGLTWVKKS